VAGGAIAPGGEEINAGGQEDAAVVGGGDGGFVGGVFTVAE
jgi:hypothetical protein